MTENKGAALLALARTAIAERLGLPCRQPACTDEDWLREKGACFVTLRKHGALRGCIGSLEAHRPLIDDVRANAVAAAFHDPRFPPLTSDEFEDIRLEISLLSALQPFPVESEADAIARLVPGRDGVMLEFGPHRGTFLPQVWDELPEASRFLAHLKLKAGLAADFWHDDIRLHRYTVDKYAESAGGRGS